MPRKIIQISSCVDDVSFYISALCNDGTVWLKFDDDVWSKIKDIPQDGYVECDKTDIKFKKISKEMDGSRKIVDFDLTFDILEKLYLYAKSITEHMDKKNKL